MKDVEFNNINAQSTQSPNFQERKNIHPQQFQIQVNKIENFDGK